MPTLADPPPRLRNSDRPRLASSRPEPSTSLGSAIKRDWTALAEAAVLLSQCAADPPASRMVEVTGLSTYHARHYVGARVRKLRAIHRSEARRLIALGDATRDYALFEAHCRRTVQQAIADALFDAAIARSAACDARALTALR